jgi:FSR family fosmidomycin resistance protein-like MFS transporter
MAKSKEARLTGSLATAKKTTPPSQAALEAKSEKFQADRVIPLAAAHGIHDTYQAFLPPLLPEFIEALALSNTQAGLLTVFLRAPSLAQPFIGYLADRVSLRYFVILAPAVTALMMSLLGIAPNYLTIVLLLLISGLSSACLHATGPVMEGRVSGRRLGHGMSYWMVGGEGGRVLGPLIITAALGTLGLAGMPWLMIGGLLTSLLLFTLLREVPARPPNAGEALPWRDALREMGPFLALILGLVVTRGFIVEAMSTYLTIFLREQQAERWLANSALALYQAAGVAGAMISGSLSDRWGRRRTLGIFLLIAPALLLGFLTVESWLRFPLLLGLGFTTISLTPVLMALVQESYPQSRALANGIYMAFSFVLRSGVTVVLGALGDAFGLTTAFTVSALVAWSGLWFVSRLEK